MRVSVPHAAKYGSDVNAGLQALLSQSKTLQFRQGETTSSAVDGCVAKDQDVVGAVVEERSGLGLATPSSLLCDRSRRGEGVLGCATLKVSTSSL